MAEHLPDLFRGSARVTTRLIERRRDFDALFDGFVRLRAISYVSSPDLLLDFFDQRGFTEVELVVGESLAPPYREALAARGVDTVLRLAARMESGALRILVPSRTLHTKLYILERFDAVRVIQTSANFTESARRARQVNYAWVLETTPGDPFLQRVMADYDAHAADGTVFMGDLMELLKDRQDGRDSREVVEAWLKGTVGDDLELEVRRVFKDLAVQALAAPGTQEEAIITVRLPDAPTARKRAEKALSGLSPTPAPNGVRVARQVFLKYVQETHGFPLLRVDRDRRQVLLGMNGERVGLTADLPSAARLDEALAHLESYLDMVDAGQTPDPRYAKTAMYEALLYVFFAPFASEYMAARRAAFGRVDLRGPRALYIFGPSSNGKSTFLTFALQILSGRPIQPLPGDQFTKTRLAQARVIGTTFPLAFDDVVGFDATSAVEEAVKSYWEVSWRAEFPQPLLVVTSNKRTLKEWAKSRVKRVDFDVHFAPDEGNRRRLADLFTQENQIFQWFSRLYFNRLAQGDLPRDDELAVARSVLGELYERAGRARPPYFPDRPLETLYDPGRLDWLYVLDTLKQARVVREQGRLLVRFSEDLQGHEVREYETHLPQNVKCRRRGHTLVIESPEAFDRWLAAGRPAPRGLLARLWGR